MLAETTIVVPATAAQLDAVHSALDHFWTAAEQTLAQPPDQVWRLQFTTAVAEISTNIVRHAYPPEQVPGPMQLRLRAYEDEVEASFTDVGAVFVPPDPATRPTADEPLALREGGYGLALIRATVDRLDYARTTQGSNEWRLVKRL